MSNLFEQRDYALCERCNARCKVDPLPNSKSKMLKRGKGDKGNLCINCAVHDWLRNTYPVNMILAGMKNPQSLLLPHIHEQFAGILRAGFSDAKPEEIDWQQIVDNWDLPWPNKVKASAFNPMSQADLDREPQRRIEERKRLIDQFKSPEEKEAEYQKGINEFLDVMRSRDEDA